MLPIEVTIWSIKRALQNYLKLANYNEAMIAKLEELDEVRLSALDCLTVQKNHAARAYDKRVKAKSFVLETSFGRRYFLSGTKIPDMESGLHTGKVHLSLSKF